MNNRMEDFLKLEKLYHYAPFDLGLRIILSGRLKFGQLSKMNDACEKEKVIYNLLRNHECQFEIKDIEEEMHRYEQISLIQDDDEKGRKGFELHQMWRMYAEKSDGVCLVFDKQKIKNRADKEKNMFHEQVNYDFELSQNNYTDIQSKDAVKSWVKENAINLYFHKRKEWEHEQEYRMVKRFDKDNEEHFFDFCDSLRYVILFDADIKKYDENNQETCKDSIITGIKYGILKNCLKMIKNVELLVYSPSIENGYSLLLHKDEEFAPIAIWTESNEQPFANDEQIDYSNLNNYMS